MKPAYTAYWYKKPYNQLMAMIMNSIHDYEIIYEGHSKKIFHRECAENIGWELTKDWKNKLKWIWIILRS